MKNLRTCKAPLLGLTMLVALSTTQLRVQAALISYWEFEGNFEDSVGGNDAVAYTFTGSGTRVNNVATGAVAGRGGQSLMLDGDGDGLVTPANNSLDFAAGDSFTYSFWFKAVPNTLDNTTSTANAGDGRSTFLMRDVQGGLFNGYAVIADTIIPGDASATSQFLRSALDAGTPSSLVQITSGVADYFDDEWHHVATVVSNIGLASGYHRLYLDGNQVHEVLDLSGLTGGTNTTSAGSNPLYIGTERANGLRWLNGAMDDLAVWNEALSESSIRALYEGTSPLNIPEPSSAALFALGIVIIACWKRLLSLSS